MITNKKGGLTGFIIVIILLLIIAGYAGFIKYEDVLVMKQKSSMCDDNGWDGFEITSKGIKCYTQTPHPSGTGYQRNYSGII